MFKTLSMTAVATILFWGCGNDLPPSSLISTVRVIGTKVSVVGDEARAWPKIGETINMRWLIGYPSDPVPLTFGFIACVAANSRASIPFCNGAPFAMVAPIDPSISEPSISVMLPIEGPITTANEILVAGVFCTAGSPSLDPSTLMTQCNDGQTAIPGMNVYSTIPIDKQPLEGAQTDYNPTIQPDAVTLAGVPWPAPAMAPSSMACANIAGVPELPRVNAATSPQTVQVRIADTDRETVLTGTRETMLMSYFTTSGQFKNQFASIEPTDATTDPYTEMDWQFSPNDTPPGGSILTRFYFVVRDQRGGVDWTLRYACLTSN